MPGQLRAMSDSIPFGSAPEPFFLTSIRHKPNRPSHEFLGDCLRLAQSQENQSAFLKCPNQLDERLHTRLQRNQTTAPNTNDKLNWEIGKGFYNTSVMKVSGATSAAQAAVLAYAGSATAGQWFIPSMNELNELCKYARGQTTGNLKVACTTDGTLKTGTANDLGGFVASKYWSSSEIDAANAWGQDFPSGSKDGRGKDNARYVRPVRAF